MEPREFLIMEVRKLISILNNYGNILVPSIEGQSETYAHDKLIHAVGRLKSEFNLTEDQIEQEIIKL